MVDEKRIEDLPLNGRDFSRLPLVQPGVAAVRNGDVIAAKGYGTRISMGGSRVDQTAWLLDGTNIRSPGSFGVPGSAAGLMLGVESVREFQVLTSDYSAEFGGTSGGVINMVTKSGTNGLHGSVFEFLRNSDLDARNFFDQAKPSFKRNQFGGALGGPIHKDRTFFFGNYEGLRQRQGVTQVSTVPDANARQGLVSAPGGGFQQATIAPEIRPYLALWPIPNGSLLGGGIATLFAPANSPANENYFVIRVDHHVNDKQTLFSRFTYDQGNLILPDAVPITANFANVHSRYATVQHEYIVTPQLLMTTRIAINRTLLTGDEIPLIAYPQNLNILLPGKLPQLTFPGATTLGPNATNLVRRIQNLYNFQENVQYIHGNHSMKMGFDVQHVGYNKGGEVAGLNGAFTWNTLTDFLADNRPSSFSATVLGALPYRTLVQYFYGAYFQDDWKMFPHFTWNLGLRYEPFTSPTEKHGRLGTMKDWVTDTTFQTGIGLFKSPAKKDLSPRVGFAWDPTGDGKTAVRAGFGLFFVDVIAPYYATPAQKNPPFFGSTASVLGNLASAFSDMTRIGPSLLSPVSNSNDLPELIQYDLNSSYEVKFNLSVERQLPGNLSLTMGYLGDRGVHLWGYADVNDAPPILVNGRPFVVAGTPRPNPNLGVGSGRYSDAQSFYNALQVELKKRFSHGLQFQSSYTWSKNIDDTTTAVGQTDYVPGGTGAVSQPYNPKADRGLSSLHMGQTLVINGMYALPAPSTGGLIHNLLGGWQVASIFTANAGVPFTVYVSNRNAPDLSRQAGNQHPDLVAGRSFSSIVTGNPNGYFDPTAFYLPPPGFYGNAGRDILIGPGVTSVDLSLQKSTPLPIREGSRLEFHADFFNLLNRANFANPRATQTQVLNATTRTYVPGVGHITSTVTNSRKMQFGLKLSF